MENMVNYKELLSFYQGKRVFITGHTGFKGSWLWNILEQAGAILWGYALAPLEKDNLFQLCAFDLRSNQTYGDITDFSTLKKVFEDFQPEIVIHLAAQPIVSIGYENPVQTYNSNVMGTVHILECCRCCSSVTSILNVTTDKVYENHEWTWGYREMERLNGFDPYSNSKSCSELVTSSYKQSFFTHLPVSTARAGNVIGGGDFAPHRIIPDCVKASILQEEIKVRNPNSIRPYQHVLDALFAYLLIAKEQIEHPEKAGAYNVGPNETDCITTGKIVSLFCTIWGNNQRWSATSGHPKNHEANFLKLDCSLLKQELHWNPIWDVKTAVSMTCQWSNIWANGGDIVAEMNKEIELFISKTRKTGDKS